MSDNNTDQEFWKRTDEVINVVNGQCESADPNEVGASAMFASARFNAFIVARSLGSADSMAAEKERALTHFTEQFHKMMEDNLDDFARNFDNYMKPAAS